MSVNRFEMSLTAGIIRTLLVATLVCFWTTDAKAQTEERRGRSTVRGTAVYADTGRPLRHALVIFYAEDRGWQGNTATDLRGQFEFTNVPAGKYILTLEAPGLIDPIANFPRADSIVPDPVYPEKSEFVTEVIVNGTDSVELKVKAVRGGVITGRVVTDDDQPVVNAGINLLRRENGKWVPVWTTWSREQSQAQQRTDASGVYRIAGLRSGEYLVRASEPFLPDDAVPGAEDAYSNGSFMVAYHPAATALKDAQAVSVVAGKESTGIDIRLLQHEPHTLMGTIKSPVLQMAGGSVEITVERIDEIGFAAVLRDITTRPGNDGKWRIDGLPAGEYQVTFSGGAVKVDADEGVDFVQALRKRIRVRIRSEQKVTVLNTTLTLGAQVQGTVTLNGRPVQQDFGLRPAVEPVDKPAAPTGAVERGDPKVLGDPDELPIHSGFVRSEGKFSITALTPGAYWFTFGKNEDVASYVKSVTRKGVDLMQTPIKLAEDQVFDDVVVTLSSDLARIEGQVTLPDGAAKELLDDLTVIMAPANKATNRFNAGTRTMQAEAGGKIVLKSGPGEYFIAALTTAEYKKIQPEISNRWFEKNAGKFLRLKVRAGEKIKALAVPMMK